VTAVPRGTKGSAAESSHGSQTKDSAPVPAAERARFAAGSKDTASANTTLLAERARFGVALRKTPRRGAAPPVSAPSAAAGAGWAAGAGLPSLLLAAVFASVSSNIAASNADINASLSPEAAAEADFWKRFQNVLFFSCAAFSAFNFSMRSSSCLRSFSSFSCRFCAALLSGLSPRGSGESDGATVPFDVPLLLEPAPILPCTVLAVWNGSDAVARWLEL